MQVILKVEKVFLKFGKPDVMKAENGQPSTVALFNPLHKPSVSSTEKYSSTTKGNEGSRLVVKTGNGKRKSSKPEMYRFLRNFRATSHTTRVPPSTALFGRARKAKLLEFNEGQKNATLAGKNQKGKAKVRRLADDSKKKRGASHQHKPQKVIRKEGPMVTARN